MKNSNHKYNKYIEKILTRIYKQTDKNEIPISCIIRALLLMLIIKTFNMDKEKMTWRQISIRARSKKEFYRILQLEADDYLPPIHQANKKYIAEVIYGKKKVHISCLIMISIWRTTSKELFKFHI